MNKLIVTALAALLVWLTQPAYANTIIGLTYAGNSFVTSDPNGSYDNCPLICTAMKWNIEFLLPLSQYVTEKNYNGTGMDLFTVTSFYSATATAGAGTPVIHSGTQYPTWAQNSFVFSGFLDSTDTKIESGATGNGAGWNLNVFGVNWQYQSFNSAVIYPEVPSEDLAYKYATGVQAGAALFDSPGKLVDPIIVVSTPELTTWGMMTLGFFALALAWRKQGRGVRV